MPVIHCHLLIYSILTFEYNCNLQLDIGKVDIIQDVCQQSPSAQLLWLAPSPIFLTGFDHILFLISSSMHMQGQPRSKIRFWNDMQQFGKEGGQTWLTWMPLECPEQNTTWTLSIQDACCLNTIMEPSVTGMHKVGHIQDA